LCKINDAAFDICRVKISNIEFFNGDQNLSFSIDENKQDDKKEKPEKENSNKTDRKNDDDNILLEKLFLIM
jgi:hypothetical protein